MFRRDLLPGREAVACSAAPLEKTTPEPLHIRPDRLRGPFRCGIAARALRSIFRLRARPDGRIAPRSDPRAPLSALLFLVVSLLSGQAANGPKRCCSVETSGPVAGDAKPMMYSIIHTCSRQAATFAPGLVGEASVLTEWRTGSINGRPLTIKL